MISKLLGKKSPRSYRDFNLFAFVFVLTKQILKPLSYVHIKCPGILHPFNAAVLRFPHYLLLHPEAGESIFL